MSDTPLPPKPNSIQTLDAIVAEMNSETDRGAALFAASMLDEKLKGIVSNFLIPSKAAKNLISQSNAPLSTFSSRQNFAASLGLITQAEYDDCDIIRRIRNDFAHKFEFAFSFNDERVRTLCDNLKVFATHGLTIDDFRRTSPTPRWTFTVSVSVLYWRWRSREKHVSDMRPKALDWDAIVWNESEDEPYANLHLNSAPPLFRK